MGAVGIGAPFAANPSTTIATISRTRASASARVAPQVAAPESSSAGQWTCLAPSSGSGATGGVYLRDSRLMPQPSKPARRGQRAQAAGGRVGSGLLLEKRNGHALLVHGLIRTAGDNPSA